MNPISSLIASVGLTSSRAFIPAFIAALLLRFGSDVPMAVEASHAALGVDKVASWFTSDISLIVLGLLATLELIAHRSQDVRAVLAEVDQYAKPAMALVLQLGLISASDADFLQKVHPATTPEAASIFGGMLAVTAAVATYIVSASRNTVLTLLHDADNDNATGAHSILAWAEDLYAALGMVLFILLPILMSVLIGAGILGIVWLRRRADRREEKSKVPCRSCRTPIYRTALTCPACRSANPEVMSLNWLGGSSDTPTNDRAAQPYLLVAKRRCPACATRLENRDPRQSCPACGKPAFASPDFVAEYDARAAANLPTTLLACAGWGLIPYVGLVVGVLLYRVQLVSPYRTYTGVVSNIATRWLLRLAIFVLLLLHLIPFAGVLLCPTMALLNYTVYRKQFLARALAAPVHTLATEPHHPPSDAHDPGTIGSLPGTVA